MTVQAENRKREYNQKWYTDHRAGEHKSTYNRQQRENHQRRIAKVSVEELPLFRQQPEREEKLGIADYVVCRECGAKLKRLRPHLKAHSLTFEGYCGVGGKFPRAPMLCVSLKDKLSQDARERTGALRGKPRHDLRSVRGHAGEAPVSKWRIVCALAEGRSYEEIGAEVNRAEATVQSTAHAIGQAGVPTLYDFGEPFTAAKFRELRDRLGLSVPELAKQVGMPAAAVTHATRGNSRLGRSIAKRVVAWRDALIRKMLSTAAQPAGSRGAYKFSGSRIFKTVLPDLSVKRKLLLSVLRAIRYQAPKTPSGADELREWLCAQASREVARGLRDGLFARFVLWAPALVQSIWDNQERIRGMGELWSVSDAILAERWGTTTAVISGVSRSRVTVIPPNEMRHLVNAERSLPQSAVAKKRRTPSEATMRKGRFCDRVIGEMRQIRGLTIDGGRSIAEIQTEHPDWAVWNLRDALGEEDRDTFNHPRQWGPVVGLALSILAKHYGKHRTTVWDWVKVYRKQARNNQT